ncbi:anti-sigma factor [Sphingomonas spermidinifaciens]|uniref:Anti-sigma factor n=1 Tax=Sphingomonas spermidinifaciens TaxID=1141889 RepID=A0A2A4B692_9SPHN|nr:anti-sigma factor [Sphingomonas spermidinifaciens]PCD03961.1 anti-sigma factor [Sphingomonas spermidinifaciens]
MTIDRETLMAYADGECDPLTARRVEKAIAADPALAAEVEAQRALRARIAAAFAPIEAEPVPPRIAAPLASNVVALPRPAKRRLPAGWIGAVAASLVLGLAVGQGLSPGGPVAAGPSGLVARGELARALDTQPGSEGAAGGIRMLASFRAQDNRYCRVFAGSATSGIACREGDGWTLPRTASGHAEAGAYRQAGSADAALLAEAQEMMAGEPLDRAGEAAAIERGWK